MQPRLYTDLAAWWPLFSAPGDYADEAAWILSAFETALGRLPATLLELGCGGGNVASHFPPQIRLTLTDLNPDILQVSRVLNPHAEHFAGDMRSLRLNRAFDAVLIHDAITYMTTPGDLTDALVTAREHLAPGGVATVLPDHIRETFAAALTSGGHDAGGESPRGVRYLEWMHAPAADSTVHQVDYAILVRDDDGSVDVIHDRHAHGIFTRDVWRKAFANAGFEPPATRADPWDREVFVARASGDIANADARRLSR